MCARPAALSGAAKSGVHVPVYRVSEGVDRVDSEGLIRFVRVNDLSAGRTVGEVLRVLDALRSGQVSPCGWHSSEPTLAIR
jgi:alkyl hydroperoxide reductase subunit AhpC